MCIESQIAAHYEAEPISASDKHIDANIPNDKRGAEIYLTARKLLLMELAAQIATGAIESLNDMSVVIWGEIKTIDEKLDGE